MDLVDATRPNAIEDELMQLVPKDRWTKFGPAMVLLGRYTCTSKEAKCGECVMSEVCAKKGV
jgi:endonuclease-3